MRSSRRPDPWQRVTSLRQLLARLYAGDRLTMPPQGYVYLLTNASNPHGQNVTALAMAALRTKPPLISFAGTTPDGGREYRLTARPASAAAST